MKNNKLGRFLYHFSKDYWLCKYSDYLWNLDIHDHDFSTLWKLCRSIKHLILFKIRKSSSYSYARAMNWVVNLELYGMRKYGYSYNEVNRYCIWYYNIIHYFKYGYTFKEYYTNIIRKDKMNADFHSINEDIDRHKKWKLYKILEEK